MNSSYVLVTGGRGFIGKRLCTRLTNMGITILSDNNYYEQRLDVTDLNQLSGIGKDIDTIIHLAAKSSVTDSFSNPYDTYYTNILGTLNLLELARLRNIRKFIFISTYVYGQPEYLPIDEKHPINPHSPYSQSKLIGEQLCKNYAIGFGNNVVILRPFYIYGPGSNNFISSAIRQIKENGKVALSGKTTKRDFLFIDDFISLLAAILDKFPTGYNLFNVGYGKSYTLREASDLLAKLMNRDVSFRYNVDMRPGDITNMQADISKVSNTFNWKPSFSLENGLESTIRHSDV